MPAKRESIFKDIDVRKLDQHTTAVGELAFGYITEPSTEYDEKGQYFLKLRFPAESKEAKRLIKIIDDAAQQAYDMAMERIESAAERKKLKRADPSYSMEEDEDGNETGNVLFNFKRKAVRVDKKGNEKPVTLRLFDSIGRPVEQEGLELWGGSEIAVAFKLVPFYTAGVGVGVSHRIEAIQIIKAVAGGDGRTAEQFGFQKHEGFIGGDSAVKSDETDDDEELDEEPDNDGIAEAAGDDGGDY